MIDENERKKLLAFVEQLQDENLLREIALILGIDVSKWDIDEPSSFGLETPIDSK